MEAVAPIRTAEEGSIVVEIDLTLLRRNCLARIDGMIVGDPADDLVGIDMSVVIEGNEVLPACPEPLQDVHIVGHSSMLCPVARHMVVPGRPGTTPRGHQRVVGMQDSLVGLVLNSAKHTEFIGCRIFQQRQRLVAVTGNEHVVEEFLAAARRLQFDAIIDASNRLHGRVEANAVAMPRDEFAYVLPRPALDDTPGWPVGGLQESVVRKEPHEELHGHIQNRHGLRRPYRSRHRHQVVINELGTEAVCRQEITQRLGVVKPIDVGAGYLVESEDIPNHAIKRRTHNVPALREQAVERRPAILDAALVHLDAETHFARLGFLADFVQQLNKVRIGPVIKHDKAGVNCVPFAVLENVDRVCVSAYVGARLKYRDVVLFPQFVSGYIAGNAGPYYRDLHYITNSVALGLAWKRRNQATPQTSRSLRSLHRKLSVCAP